MRSLPDEVDQKLRPTLLSIVLFVPGQPGVWRSAHLHRPWQRQWRAGRGSQSRHRGDPA